MEEVSFLGYQKSDDPPKYLLMNTYSHHGVESEVEFYREQGFDNLEAIPRRIETLEIPSDAEDEISKYLFGFYSIFEIKS